MNRLGWYCDLMYFISQWTAHKQCAPSAKPPEWVAWPLLPSESFFGLPQCIPRGFKGQDSKSWRHSNCIRCSPSRQMISYHVNISGHVKDSKVNFESQDDLHNIHKQMIETWHTQQSIEHVDRIKTVSVDSQSLILPKSGNSIPNA